MFPDPTISYFLTDAELEELVSLPDIERRLAELAMAAAEAEHEQALRRIDRDDTPHPHPIYTGPSTPEMQQEQDALDQRRRRIFADAYRTMGEVPPPSTPSEVPRPVLHDPLERRESAPTPRRIRKSDVKEDFSEEKSYEEGYNAY